MLRHTLLPQLPMLLHTLLPLLHTLLPLLHTLLPLPALRVLVCAAVHACVRWCTSVPRGECCARARVRPVRTCVCFPLSLRMCECVGFFLVLCANSHELWQPPTHIHIQM
jgi:hypothetical protein